MKYPDWVLKHKVKNSEIRCIKGNYYLYSITSQWDPEKKRTKKITLGMIGVIKEKEGLIPKGQSKKGRPLKIQEVSKVTTKEFGASHLLQEIGNDIIEKLKDYFPNHWQSLLVLAINSLIYQAPFKNAELLWSESFFSEVFREAQLHKNACSQLLQRVGSDREMISKFLQEFIQGAEHIIFDASHITSAHKATIRK